MRFVAEAETPDETPAGTPEEKAEPPGSGGVPREGGESGGVPREGAGSGGVPREEIMRRLGEIIRAGPPDLSGAGSGPVTAGGFPLLPSDAGEFDQESAAKLLAELGRFFERQTREEGGEGAERE